MMLFVRLKFWGVAAATLLLAACGGGSGSDTADSGPTEYCVMGASVPPAVASVMPPTFNLAALTTATSDRFAGSGLCASCHRADTETDPDTNFDTVTGEQVDLTADWAGSMMANSARDPYFHAVLSAEMAANPTHAGSIQGKCLTCHAPMAAYEAKVAGNSLTLADLESGVHSELGKDGVSCVLCHRIEGSNLGPSGESYAGNFIIGNETGSARKIYGPYTNVATDPMIRRVNFTPAYGKHVRDSALCGTCHNLTTEAIDPVSQELTGIQFPEQMPYKEWLASSYNSSTNPKSCQSCHMPETVGGVRLSNTGPTRTQSPFGKHHFVGANAFMLTMLKNNRETTNSLGLVADPSAFEAAIVRTRNNLTQNAARLEANPCRKDNMLTVPVTITNLAGHKFPTSYPNRRAWLHVKVTDGTGRTVFESGNYGADGEIVGLDLDYEPHYDTITRPDQVQVYETVMGDVRDNQTRRLMHAARYLKDNRILPAGMSPDETDTDIRVVGIGSDANFVGGSDRVTYSIDTTGYTGPFKVTAELLYQSVPPRDVAALSYVTSQITSFKAMYAAADKAPERVASVALNLQ
jgi:cytochrome c551/c552